MRFPGRPEPFGPGRVDWQIGRASPPHKRVRRCNGAMMAPMSIASFLLPIGDKPPKACNRGGEGHRHPSADREPAGTRNGPAVMSWQCAVRLHNDFRPCKGPDGGARLRSPLPAWKRSNGRKTNGAHGGSDSDLHRTRFASLHDQCLRWRDPRFPSLRRAGLRRAEAVIGLGPRAREKPRPRQIPTTHQPRMAPRDRPYERDPGTSARDGTE